MAGYKPTEIRKPENDKDFEEQCVVLFREILNDPHVKTVGTSGQGQDGVDVVGIRDGDPHKIVGIQCKLKSGYSKLTRSEVEKEFTNALKFKPNLSEYIIVTTSKDDTKLDQLAQSLAQQERSAGRIIKISVWGWNTLCQHINRYPAAKEAFDPGHSPAIAQTNERLAAIEGHQGKAATRDQVDALARQLEAQAHSLSEVLPASYANQEGRKRLQIIQKRRGFAGADTAAELDGLADRVITGDLVRVSGPLGAEICDRAARACSFVAGPSRLQDLIEHAFRLDSQRDLTIARAMATALNGDGEGAMRTLRARADPESRSAMVATLILLRGWSDALDWVESEKLAPSDFSAIGATNVVVHWIEQGQIGKAASFVEQVPASYFDEAPGLLLLRARLRLTSILPEDRKAQIFHGIPLSPRQMEFEAGSRGQDVLQAAHADLVRLSSALEDAELDGVRAFVSELALWLSLEIDGTRGAALARLTSEIQDPKLTLSRVGLALSYGVPFNQDALMRSLESQKSYGGWNEEQRLAAFLIAFHEHGAEKISILFDTHGDEIFNSKSLDNAMLWGVRIEALARCDRIQEAYDILSQVEGSKLTHAQSADLRDVIAGIEARDEAAVLRRRYETTPDLANLRALVEYLRVRRDKSGLAEFASILVRQTKSLRDFDIAIKNLYACRRFADVVSLCRDFDEITERSDEYKSVKAWALAMIGRVMDARAISRTLSLSSGDRGVRELAIMTSVESGDWGGVQSVLAFEAARADELPIDDLLRLARIALETESHYVNYFRDAALNRDPDNPHVNLAAYTLAIERGAEYETKEVHAWFEKALENSGPDGPVQAVSLQQMLDQAPRWNEHANSVEEKFRRAEIPCFIAAEAGRRQILDRTLGQAIRNVERDDDLIPYPVFAFSGARRPLDLREAKTVGFDITALITLFHLGLLKDVLSLVKRPVIAPSTLSQLLLERQHLRVHQPSQVKKAERLLALIDAGDLKIMQLGPASSVERSWEMADDLASMLAAAVQDGGLVVATAPISKRGSLLEETVDMRPFTSLLADTHAVLALLDASGGLDRKARDVAARYLRSVDEGWPSGPSLSRDRPIYLDDLALNYLDFVGALSPFARAVKTVFVHPDVVREARARVKHRAQSDQLVDAIEKIRELLNSQLELGHLTFSARSNAREDDPEGGLGHIRPSPTMDLMTDLSELDIVVVDDRNLNRMSTWADRVGGKVRIASVIDILDLLHGDRGSDPFSQEERWQSRHKLRAAGFHAVPLDTDELLVHVTAAPISSERIVETPELKAIRTSILLPLMTPCFVEGERPWLDHIRMAILDAIRRLWAEPNRNGSASARSDWLLDRLPIPMEWANDPVNDAAWSTARRQTAGQAGLLTLAVGLPGARRKEFLEWLDSRVISPMRNSHPDLWRIALQFVKNGITQFCEAIGQEHGPDHVELAADFMIAPLPREVRIEVFSDDDFCRRIGIETEKSLTLGADTEVTIESLYKATQNAVNGKKSAGLKFLERKPSRVRVKSKDGRSAEILVGGQRFILDDADVAASNRTVRVKAIDRLLALSPLPEAEEQRWREIADDRPLTFDEFFALRRALAETPEAFHSTLRAMNRFSVETLVPREMPYYGALLADFQVGQSFADFVSGPLREARQSLLRRQPERALRRIAFSAVGDSLVPIDLIQSLDLQSISGLLHAEDPFSLIFGFETCAARVLADSQYGDLGGEFLRKAIADQARALTRCQILSGAAILTSVQLRQHAGVPDAPVAWARLVALTHGGVVADAMCRVRDAANFQSWATGLMGFEYAWRSTLDRRCWPRWRGEWILPEQMNAEIIARAIKSVNRLPADQRPTDWIDILEPVVQSLANNANGANVLIPGPFDEINGSPLEEMPPDVQKTIDAALANDTSLDAVRGLAYLAYANVPSPSVVSHLVRMLKRPGRQPIGAGGSEVDLLDICAHMAGTTRSVDLASAVIGRCLEEATSTDPGAPAQSLFLVIANACAAFSDRFEYHKQIGESAKRLSFAASSAEELSRLAQALVVLGNIDTRLLPHLAAARAVAVSRR